MPIQSTESAIALAEFIYAVKLLLNLVMSKPIKKSKQQKLCKICHKRPVWPYKNNPDRVCKCCYHKHVWRDRPSARKEIVEVEEIDIDSQTEEFVNYYGVSGSDAYYWLFIADED